MKKLLAILILTVTALVDTLGAAPVDSVLVSTVDASAYTAGATAVKTIRILSVDYVTGLVRFQLLNTSGVAYGSGAVFGMTDPTITPENIPAKLLAVIGG